ncbi:MAG: hypothetical protein LUC34_01895 [Campylobacter sp.]|nr:hypothetical protein [Campylobacter sp.]
MKVLFVDLSRYPTAIFPQLGKEINIREDKVHSQEHYPDFFKQYCSFPEERLFGYEGSDDLLQAFCKKHGYDGFKFI